MARWPHSSVRKLPMHFTLFPFRRLMALSVVVVVLSSALVSNGLFPSKLQGLQLPDIPVTAGLLGSLGAITG